MIYNTMQLEDYKFYFSKERIGSYESVEQHDQNLHLISKISIHLGIFELFFRNRIDNFLRDQTENDEWLIDLINIFENIEPDDMIEIEKNMYRDIKKIRIKHKTHAQIVSSLSFGFWVNLAKLLIFGWEGHNIAQASYTEILDVSKINLTNYSRRNRNPSDNNLKLILVIRLIQHIRNRAFHWENLLKTNKNNCGKILPNITAKEQNNLVGIFPIKIETFLQDVLKCIDKRLIGLTERTLG